MKFLVDYGSKKAQQKLLKLPPLLQKRLKFVLYFGGAQAAAIKHRVADRGLAADFSKSNTTTGQVACGQGGRPGLLVSTCRLSF